MANWTRLANGVNYGNQTLNIDYYIASTSRTSATNVNVTFGIRFSMSGTGWTSNSICAFVDGAKYWAMYSPSGSSKTSSGTYYYANGSTKNRVYGASSNAPYTTTSETYNLTTSITVSGATTTSGSFKVGFGWGGWDPSQKGELSISVSFASWVVTPSSLSCSLSSKTETTVTLSGSCGNNGNGTITANGYQYYGGSVSSWTAFSNGSTKLSPNTTYHFRYYATNSAGTGYSSTVDVTTYANPSVKTTPNVTIGNSLTITIDNPNKRSCSIYFINTAGTSMLAGTTTGTTVSDFTSDTWKNHMYAGIPAAKSGQYKIRLVCSALSIDTTVTGGTYSIKGTEYPTFDTSYVTDIKDTLNTGITGNASKIIQNHNKVTCTVKPGSSAYYATMDKYTISGTGLTASSKNHTGSNLSFDVGNLSTANFTVTATDKRTLVKAATVSLGSNFISYGNPTLVSCNIVRQDAIGDHVYLNLSGKYTNWSGLSKSNTISSVKFRYKEDGTSNWSGWSAITKFTSSGGNWSVKDLLLDIVFDNTKRYNIEFQVGDLLESPTFTGNYIPAANAFIWKDLKNKRLGIGKKPNYTLDVNGEINADKNIYIGGKAVMSTTLLFSGTAWEKGVTYTLNDSINNYDYIEVFFDRGGTFGGQSVKVDRSQFGNTFIAPMFFYNEDNAIRLVLRTFKITFSGSTFVINGVQDAEFRSGQYPNIYERTVDQYDNISKIIGYIR